MLEAIYKGLIYGTIAGFATLGFVLTMALVYGFIEAISTIFGIHDDIFEDTPGGYDGRRRRK